MHLSVPAAPDLHGCLFASSSNLSLRARLTIDPVFSTRVVDQNLMKTNIEFRDKIAYSMYIMSLYISAYIYLLIYLVHIYLTYIYLTI